MRVNKKWIVRAVAFIVPAAYLCLYAPYGMDTTDFGYFYGYAWRILMGQVPYRDFAYIKPAFPLYWHAFWMALTPDGWEILAGKAGFFVSLLVSSWLGALYLSRLFAPAKTGVPTPLLATCGFVFAAHSFPAMPWHTPDGVLFASAALFSASRGAPGIAGVFAALSTLCKQSFLLAPAALLFFVFVYERKRLAWLKFAFACVITIFLAAAFLVWQGAWRDFLVMTTGQLDIREAIDAGILIYLRQNWFIPALALAPASLFLLGKRRPPAFLSPCVCYLLILTIYYVYSVLSQKTWIGFGASWPTLFMLAGAACVLAPRFFLVPALNGEFARPRLVASAGLLAALVVSWSTAISGGYKIPVFFATPLLFSFFILQFSLKYNPRSLAWLALACGLIMFRVGHEYPYVFPVKPLERSAMIYDAGDVYPKARGVKVDRDTLNKLSELKYLRAKYGSSYKTLPGFTLAYYLNDDTPAYKSDWLIDWEINGKVDEFYKELLDKKLYVFMERDQADAVKADAYERAGYGVPQLVRKRWKLIEETPSFLVYEAPGK